MSLKYRQLTSKTATISISIIGAIVTLIGTILVALIQFVPGFENKYFPTTTILPSYTLTLTQIPTSTLTPTSTPIISTATSSPTLIGDISSLLSEISSLKGQISSLQQQVDTLSGKVSDSAHESGLIQIQNSLNSVSDRLQSLEKVILDNPSKALEVTLLRIELENLQQSYQTDLQSMHDEINRVYDLNKWFIGLMFTIAIGLLSLGVSNFITKPSKEGKEKSEQTMVDAKDVKKSE